MLVKDDLGGMAGAYELIDWHDDFDLLWQSANYTGAEAGAAGAGVASSSSGSSSSSSSGCGFSAKHRWMQTE